MDNKKILYSFCELLRVFEFTNRVMLTVQMKQQQVKVVGNKKWCSQLSDASHP